MSTLAYAQLTNAREAAQPGTSTTTSKPGIQTYMDAFAALVPAEVLTLHALIISATTTTHTEKVAGSAAEKTAALASWILPEGMLTLQMSFFGLLAMSIALYAIPRYTGGDWDVFDWIRALIAPLAFVGWTMLQRTSAFDAICQGLSQPPRTVMALFLAAILGATTAALALKADKKKPRAS